jgi:uncharacterized glyoxalase superfamily protein PhnB
MTENSDEIRFQAVTPVLRIFDVAKAKEFYVDYLGFHWDWEHRFHDNAPLYGQISRGGLIFHLSEHHGDGSPGAAVIVTISDVGAYHRELAAKRYRYMNPGLEESQWEGRTVQVWDPFGNRIRFREPKAA